MASAENFIGQGACPVCGSIKARFSVSKKQLCCMACNTCNSQIFARSDFSDEKLRACIRTPATASATGPAAAQSAPVAATLPAPAQNVPAGRVEAPVKKGFGLMGAW